MSGSSSVSRTIGRKGSGGRAWVLLSGAGERKAVEGGRGVIMRRTGLASRDLRILDPVLSYPSTILGRERAMVIKLEHIKAIITAQEVFLLNSKDPSVIPFVQHLQSRIFRHHRATQPQDGNSVDSNWTEVHDSVEPQSRTVCPQNTSMEFMQLQDQNGEDNTDRMKGGMKILPFEFVALEACLEAACSELENEANILEKEAHPALDSLTSEISSLNLERVRQIKSHLVDITSRVQKVRDELENLLDDDEDMAELYLTDKLVQQQFESSTVSSMNDGDSTVNQVLQLDLNDRICPEISLQLGGGSGSNDHQNAADFSRDQMFGASNRVSSNTQGTQAATTYSAETNKLDSGELEMILGAYFVQTGGILNKLFTLREYVDDTEDYINIMLDDKQNRLLQMSVKLNTANLLGNAFHAVTGVFAMNIHIDIYDYDAGLPRFLWATFGCTAVCIFLYMVALTWYKHKRLLE